MKQKATVQKLGLVLLMVLSSVQVYAQRMDSPAATVRLTETEVVTSRQLQHDIELIEQQAQIELNAAQRREVLDAKINEILIKQAANRANITVSDSDVDAMIQQQRAQLGQQVTDAQFRQLVEQQTGMSYEYFREQIWGSLLQQQYIAQAKRDLFTNAQPPSDEEIQQVYEENQTKFINPAMVGFSHIFYDTRNVGEDRRQEIRARADARYREIRNGQISFQEAVNNALDDSTVQAGNFGYLHRGDNQARALLGENFVDAVFALDENEVSRVIESNLGFHIVKISDKRAPRMLELDDPLLPGQTLTVRAQIVQYIMQQRQQQLLEQALTEIISELRAEAEITVFEQNL